MNPRIFKLAKEAGVDALFVRRASQGIEYPWLERFFFLAQAEALEEASVSHAEDRSWPEWALKDMAEQKRKEAE